MKQLSIEELKDMREFAQKHRYTRFVQLIDETIAIREAQGMPVAVVYAELYRLREEIKGPDGFATWKEAAIAERVKNKAIPVAHPIEDIDYLTAMSAFHSDEWHKMGPITAYMRGWNARNSAFTTQPIPVKPDNRITAEHQCVIQMLLDVCGAAFELADDSCQQDVDGEDCHVVPDISFSRLSDALDKIESTLPDEYEDLPNIVLQWAAIPRHALRDVFTAPQLPVDVSYDELFNAIGKAVNIQGESLSISVKAFKAAIEAAGCAVKSDDEL